MRNRILVAAILAAAAAGAAPAFAQPVDQLTVTGQWNGRGEPPATLSRVVDYGDLDLRNLADQDTLRQRVQSAARGICDQLGESRPDHTNLGRSCEERAVHDAQDQMRLAVANAMTGTGPAYAAAPPPSAAPSAETAAQPASFTTTTVTNGPVPDTPENRARYGGPMSHAGKHTRATGD